MLNLKNENYLIAIKSIIWSIILTFVSKICINYLGLKGLQYENNETTVNLLGGLLIYGFMFFSVIGLTFTFLYFLMLSVKESHEIMLLIGSLILVYSIFLGIGFYPVVKFNVL